MELQERIAVLGGKLVVFHKANIAHLLRRFHHLPERRDFRADAPGAAAGRIVPDRLDDRTDLVEAVHTEDRESQRLQLHLPLHLQRAHHLAQRFQFAESALPVRQKHQPVRYAVHGLGGELQRQPSLPFDLIPEGVLDHILSHALPPLLPAGSAGSAGPAARSAPPLGLNEEQRIPSPKKLISRIVPALQVMFFPPGVACWIIIMPFFIITVLPVVTSAWTQFSQFDLSFISLPSFLLLGLGRSVSAVLHVMRQPPLRTVFYCRPVVARCCFFLLCLYRAIAICTYCYIALYSFIILLITKNY